MPDKKKNTQNHKKDDGNFHSKNSKHSPQAESAKAVFGVNNERANKKNPPQ